MKVQHWFFLYIYVFLHHNTYANVNLYTYTPDSYVTINNNILRESLNSSYFAFDSKYTFQLPRDSTIQSFKTNQWFQGTNLRKDFTVSQIPYEIGSISYNQSHSHMFHFIINIISKKNFNGFITHNGEKQKIVNNLHNGISQYFSSIQQPGIHIWKLFIYAPQGTSCNCPSHGNGYVNSRYFFGWITPIQQKKSLLVSNGIHPVRITNYIQNRNVYSKNKIHIQ